MPSPEYCELLLSSESVLPVLCLAQVGTSVDSVAPWRVLVSSHRMSPGVTKGVSVAYLQVTSNRGSEGD